MNVICCDVRALHVQEVICWWIKLGNNNWLVCTIASHLTLICLEVICGLAKSVINEHTKYTYTVCLACHKNFMRD